MAKTAELWLAARDVVLSFKRLGEENYISGTDIAYQQVQRKKSFLSYLERLEEFVDQPLEYEHERELDKHYRMGWEAGLRELQDYCRYCDTKEHFLCPVCSEEIHAGGSRCSTNNHHIFINTTTIRVF